MPPSRQPSSKSTKTNASATSSRTTASRTKASSNLTPDALAETIATKLTISEKSSSGKGKAKAEAAPWDPEERRLTAMRAVNTSSKKLSSIIAAGWKPTVEQGKKSGTSIESVKKMLEEMRSDLNLLRDMQGADLDVERAASSVVGKAVSLELYDAALQHVMDMRDALPRLYAPNAASTPDPSHERYICLPPIPENGAEPSDIIYSLISSHFVHSLSTYCGLLRTSGPVSPAMTLEQFARAVHEGQPSSFVSWMNHLASNTSRAKIVDSACTKLYTTFAKTASTLVSTPAPLTRQPSSAPTSSSSSSPSASASSIFRLRIFAVLCLAYTSPGVIESEAFWAEVGKVIGDYKDSDARTRQSLVLASLDAVVGVVERRADKDTFLDPMRKRLRYVLDGWVAVARAANDMSALSRVSALVGDDLSTVGAPSSTTSQTSLDDADATRLCSTLVKTESFLSRQLDPASSSDDASMDLPPSAAVDALRRSSPFIAAFIQPGSGLESQGPEKVKRMAERVRRYAAKVSELPTASESVRSCALQLLQESAEGYEEVFTSLQTLSDNAQTLLLSWLDSLFVLAKSALKLSHPDTYDAAFTWLERGWKILQTASSYSPTTFSNHLRILSCAFYNLAGALYRSEKYAFAGRFLERGCIIGQTALTAHKMDASNTAEPASSLPGEQDMWSALEEGLYKRWEVLGVCYSKTGERKLAYEAFFGAIRCYPFFAQSFQDVALRTPSSLLFSSFPTISATLAPSSPFLSASVTQLGVLIDRITYMGTCELFLEPHQVSLRHLLPVEDDAGSIVVGVLLERQIHSLEPSRHKPAVKRTISVLLKDALDVYALDGKLPIRRAGIWLKWLENSYFGGPDFNVFPVDVKAIGDETQKLLSYEDFLMDTPIVHLRIQYQVMLHLWLALHIHRSGVKADHPQIVYHSEEAYKIMKAMLQIGPPTKSQLRPKVKFASPKQIAAPAKRAMGRSTTKVKATAVKSKVPKAVVMPPVTPKPKKALRTSSDLLTQESSSISRPSSALPLDSFTKLCDLLQMVSQLLGLLGHVVTKIQLLNVSRRLCEHHVETRPEDFLRASLDLGHEYARLGKSERAAQIYASIRHCISNSIVPDELKALYFLRYAELLGTIGNVLKGASTYCEATGILEKLESQDDKAVSTAERVNLRVTALERVAVAATSFATLQYSKDDPTASLNGLLQALRLYHRATDTFTRLAPPPKSSSSDNPFDMSDLKDAPMSNKDESPGFQQPPAPDHPPRKTYSRRNTLSSLEWRIASGLLTTLFSLAQAYLARGSAREAEYFVLQAKDLAESLDASAMICRALTKLGELKLCMGKPEEAHNCLKSAADLVEAGVGGIDAANLRRLRGQFSTKATQDARHAKASYEEAMVMLEELDELLATHDTSINGPRRLSGSSPRSSLAPQHDSLMPSLFVAVLRQNIALLHGAGEEYRDLLDRLRGLPTTAETKAEESSLFAKLALEDAYASFRADMLLGSLAESTITLPMGMTGERITTSPASQEILGTLTAAEKLFWSDLALMARRGRVSHVRDAAVSLGLIKAFQTSLGQSLSEGPTLTARLLDSSAAITLRREMVEIIQHKFSDVAAQNDLQWPVITANGSVMPPPMRRPNPRSRLHRPRGRSGSISSDSDPEDDVRTSRSGSEKSYWQFIVSRYSAHLYDPSILRSTQTALLPPHWSIISITLTSDQKSLFVSRQRRDGEPLIFCIPLKGRRDNEDEDEDNADSEARTLAEGGQLGYTDVIGELDEVIRLSDEGTRGAVKVDKTDKHARAKWWKERSDLDKRMKTLLENIEFCWLGAFKTILCEPVPLPSSVLSSFRTRLESIFVRTLLPPAPGPPTSRPKHKAKSSSSSRNAARFDVTLTDALLETFANLPHNAPSEELEDLAYFILDLYAFHGGPNMGVVVAEVDMDQLVLDLRSALEEVSTGRQKHQEKLKKMGKAADEDHHTFLVLDKNMQGIPWECIPILRGKSVSRIPSMEFLIDRIVWARQQRELPLPVSSTSAENISDVQNRVESNSDEESSGSIDRVHVEPTNTYVILNPSGDLKNTEGRFVDWVSQMQKGAGWEAIVGRAPSETEMASALATKDLVIYFGHGGAEQYIRSHKIRHLERCAATMLWGCSSGTLKDMGEFDRVGTPLNYIVAGCPTLVANLWDVTDRDIDKFSQAVFDKVHLTEVQDVKSWRSRSVNTGEQDKKPYSIIRAIAESRDCCKLKYLTGAAPVVYGIPFYL